MRQIAMTKDPQELGALREQRIRDAIALRLPDRVPVMPMFQFFPAFYAGITPHEAMYDYEKARMAWKKTILDFEPDLYAGPALFRSGPVLETLDCRQLRWPGHGVDAHHAYQFVEAEYMPAEEYDEFIENPSDWMIRRYMPRIFGALTPFQNLPGILDQFYYYGAPSAGLATMGTPQVQEAFQSLLKAARESHAWVSGLVSFVQEMKQLGFSPMFLVATYAPFDLIGDNFRGTRGMALDMYRRPEKLLAALEKMTGLTIKMATRRAASGGIPIVFIPLHKGSEGFMSPEQFKTFYWPSLRTLILGLCAAGCIPYVYTEGDYTSRLEFLRDVPKGKVMYHFQKVDMARAKAILREVACIVGDVPNSLLISGTADQVKDYCRKLIDTAGEGGGFIMDSSACIDEAKPENIRAMIDFTKAYGVYRRA
jgi:uroporphyrinogen-III decarboxylase